MKHLIQQLRERLWDFDAAARYPRAAVRTARYAYVLGRDLMEGQLNMRAMSLVYTTLLSLVPMLALAFSVLKALGVHNSLEPVLLELLYPLGDKAHEITASVIGFVEKIQVGVLGSLGVALLFYAAVSMIQKVESSFNYIWRVERARPLSQRLGEYLAVLTVGPVMVFAALGITGTLLSSSLVVSITRVEPLGFLVYLFTRMLPYILIISAFTFFYSFVPNTRVRLGPALAGGLLAGVLWQSGSLAFASFVASASNYNAIYSGFAIFLFLLIWLYLGWLILLTGCQLAFYVQNPQHLKALKTPPSLSGRSTEYLALMIMTLTGRRFLKGEPGCTHEELCLALNAAPEHVLRVTELLIFHGLLTEAGAERTRLVPAMDLDAVALSRLWRLARAGSEPLPKSANADAASVLRVVDEAESLFEKKYGELSLKSFLSQKHD